MFTQDDVHQQFAEFFGIADLRPYAYLVSRKLSEGHICLDLDKPYESGENLPGYCQQISPGDRILRTIPLVAKDGNDNQPFVLDGNRLYLQRYFRYETSFLGSLMAFLRGEEHLLTERRKGIEAHAALIKRLLVTPGGGSGDAARVADAAGGANAAEPVDTTETADRADWQLAAAITAILHNFTIITGGPGTGKTTTVARILAILYAINPSLTAVLAAPTGKAAARMAESLRNTGIPLEKNIAEKFETLTPLTIHRLLKPQPGTPYFRYNRDNPLPFDVVIVDECSMIDVALFAKLMEAIGPHTRIILLGDKDQLASVEAGSLFGDICQAQARLNFFSEQRLSLINSFITNPGRQIPVNRIDNDPTHPLFQHLVELRYSRRFSANHGIGKFSKALISEDLPGLEEANDQVVIDPGYSPGLFEQFISGYSVFILEKDTREALRKLNALRVLCAVREGEKGVYAVNRAIERFLHDKKFIQANSEFYENRPLILNRNYYEHGLFNGDIGLIRPDEKGVLMAWFEDSSGELKAILPSYLGEAETVFAMTIHKSQGSEFDEVLVVLSDSTETRIVTRELLYTAVTRAKKRVYIQAPMAVIFAAAKRHVERASGIAFRFQNL